jgi:hypothetical protein
MTKIFDNIDQRLSGQLQLNFEAYDRMDVAVGYLTYVAGRSSISWCETSHEAIGTADDLVDSHGS